MGKNYRNCKNVFTKIPQPSRLREDPSKRKESITSCNWLASTVSRTNVRSGESICYWPNSEKLPVNYLPSKKKTPEDFSKALPF